MTIKPRLFIGSASEDLGIVDLLRTQLEGVAQVVPWKQLREFGEEFTNYTALIKSVNTFDFGLFVLGATDTASIRDKSERIARDNVYIEMGMFIGALGPSRVMAAVERKSIDDTKSKTLADLEGVIMPTYDSTNATTKEQSISEISNQFRQRIQYHKRRKHFLQLATGWHYDIANREFQLNIDAPRLTYNQAVIGANLLAVVVRMHSNRVDRLDDTRIGFSGLRKWRDDNQDIEFAIPKKDIPDLGAGKTIEANILLVPEGTELANYKTLMELTEKAGCQIVDRVTYTIGEACPAPTCPLARNETI